jgi:hypothetical protein
MLILYQQQLILEPFLLLEGRKDFVSEERLELFVLVRRDIETNAAGDLPLVGILDHLNISITPSESAVPLRARIHRRSASAKGTKSGASNSLK